jgi:sterol desaturase/sphingolipid hydroxylase (fatty acid hydroxylase superfamily)
MQGGEKSARVFDNDVLETLSRSHPVLNTAVGVALAGCCLWLVNFNRLGAAGSAGTALAVAAAWPLIEYLAHRFFFHWTPKNPAVAKALYLVHQYHHDFPNERSRNMFPLVVSLPLALAAWLVFWAALPRDAALVGFATIVLCFTYYDLVHYLHHLPTPWLPGLRRRHMLHHFRDPDANFGVTTSLWDRIFGTLKSETPVRTLRPQI